MFRKSPFPLHVSLTSILLLVSAAGGAAAGALQPIPVRLAEGAQSLNGDWAFHYVRGNEPGAAADFLNPDFDASSWKKIAVPSNWELHGFAEPLVPLASAWPTALTRWLGKPAGTAEAFRPVYHSDDQ